MLLYKIEIFSVPYGGPYGKIEWRKYTGSLTIAEVARFFSERDIHNWDFNESIKTEPDSMGTFYFYRVTKDESLLEFKNSTNLEHFKIICEKALNYFQKNEIKANNEKEIFNKLKKLF